MRQKKSKSHKGRRPTSRAELPAQPPVEAETGSITPSLLHSAGREARLLEELEAERVENQRLRQTITSLQKQLGMGTENDLTYAPLRPKKPRSRSEEWTQLFREEGQAANSFSKKSFPRYLLGIINTSTPARLIKKITLFFRRVRLVRLIITIGTAAVTAVLLLPMYVVALPVMLALSGLTAFLSIFCAYRKHRTLRRELAGKHLYVFVATDDDRLRPGSFFSRSVHQLAHMPGYAVLVISPHNFRTQGLGGKGAYLTARRECDGLYLVRRHYFFSLRRRVLRTIDEHMVIVY